MRARKLGKQRGSVGERARVFDLGTGVEKTEGSGDGWRFFV